MQKKYFYNKNLNNKNSDKKKLLQSASLESNDVVDINILLNRVKIEEKYQIKRKIIFFSLVTLTLIVFGTCIAIIK